MDVYCTVNEMDLTVFTELVIWQQTTWMMLYCVTPSAPSANERSFRRRGAHWPKIFQPTRVRDASKWTTLKVKKKKSSDTVFKDGVLKSWQQESLLTTQMNRVWGYLTVRWWGLEQYLHRPAGGAGSQGLKCWAGGRIWRWLLGHSSLSPDECFNCRDVFL